MNKLSERMIGWYEGQLDLLNKELKMIESHVAPDYVQDKDMYNREILRSEMIMDEIRDINIALGK
jgi:hypothetical protein